MINITKAKKPGLLDEKGRRRMSGKFGGHNRPKIAPIARPPRNNIPFIKSRTGDKLEQKKDSQDCEK
ncbi:MAG: hypothetical protein ACI8RD_006674 [Bacillariaceae sp.]